MKPNSLCHRRPSVRPSAPFEPCCREACALWIVEREHPDGGLCADRAGAIALRQLSAALENRRLAVQEAAGARFDAPVVVDTPSPPKPAQETVAVTREVEIAEPTDDTDAQEALVSAGDTATAPAIVVPEDQREQAARLVERLCARTTGLHLATCLIADVHDDGTLLAMEQAERASRNRKRVVYEIERRRKILRGDDAPLQLEGHYKNGPAGPLDEPAFDGAITRRQAQHVATLVREHGVPARTVLKCFKLEDGGYETIKKERLPNVIEWIENYRLN